MQQYNRDERDEEYLQVKNRDAHQIKQKRVAELN